MKTTLYIIRHGTTDYNIKMRFQGRGNIPLNEQGKAQAAFLTPYFEDIPIDVAYSSPLLRAQQTMLGVLGKRQMNIHLEEDIIEIDGGDIEGKYFPECDPELLDVFENHPGQFKIPGGESAKEVSERVVRGFMKIVKANPGKTIVAVSHGFAIQTWLNYAQGHKIEDMKKQILNNVSVSRFDFDEAFNLSINYIGDEHHLPDHLRIGFNLKQADLKKGELEASVEPGEEKSPLGEESPSGQTEKDSEETQDTAQDKQKTQSDEQAESEAEEDPIAALLKVAQSVADVAVQAITTTCEVAQNVAETIADTVNKVHENEEHTNTSEENPSQE